MTISDSEIFVFRPLCPLCRGDGFVLRGNTVARCPECDRREWEEFSRGQRDLPPCWGHASCSEQCMGLCPWAKGCKEAVTG